MEIKYSFDNFKLFKIICLKEYVYSMVFVMVVNVLVFWKVKCFML